MDDKSGLLGLINPHTTTINRASIRLILDHQKFNKLVCIYTWIRPSFQGMKKISSILLTVVWLVKKGLCYSDKDNLLPLFLTFLFGPKSAESSSLSLVTYIWSWSRIFLTFLLLSLLGITVKTSAPVAVTSGIISASLCRSVYWTEVTSLSILIRTLIGTLLEHLMYYWWTESLSR